MFLTEFGACSDSKACYNEILSVVKITEENFISWSYWNYKPYGDHTTSAIEMVSYEGIYNDDGTVQNIKERGAFTVAIADVKHVAEADYLGIVSANNVKDKFEKSGLHAVKSQNVDAPVIEEYPICMECKVLGFEDDGTLVEVVNVLADEKYLNEDGSIKLDEIGIISYDPFGHGYYEVGKKVGNAFSEGKKLM